MKNSYKILFLIAVTWGIAIPRLWSQTVTLPQVSPKASVSQTVGIATIHIDYSRPNVVSPQGADRTGQIWGSLVPNGFNDLGFGTSKEAPWRAGANENTVITISHDVMVEGKNLPAGTYGLHMSIEEGESVIVIFSKDTESWGSFFYEPANDALRVNVSSLENSQTPLLTYSFPEADINSALLVLDWEKKRIPIRFEFDTPELTYRKLSEELKSVPGFDYQNWVAASSYLTNQNVHMDKALEWANDAISLPFVGQKNFISLQNKASVLTTMGKTDDASEVMKEALDDPTASIENYYTYGRTLISQDRKEEAMDLFKNASKKWPDHWLAPHGLARGYSATGDFKKALKYEQEAYTEAPATSKQFLEGYLKILEEGKDFN